MDRFVSKFKCKECFKYTPALSPHLVDSGYAAPFDGKCPICDTIHSLSNGKIIKDTSPMQMFRSSGNGWLNQKKIDSFY